MIILEYPTKANLNFIHENTYQWFFFYLIAFKANDTHHAPAARQNVSKTLSTISIETHSLN